MAQKTKCKRCNHEWIYKGNKLVTNCPNCRTSIRVRKFNPNEDVKISNPEHNKKPKGAASTNKNINEGDA